MLVAEKDSVRIEALDAEKGNAYRCPKCGEEVVLKKGRIVVHHFAHKTGGDCSWAVGETREHMTAKRLLANGMRRRGLTAEIEKVVISIDGDRRADVLITCSSGKSAAVEIQHTPIAYQEIERRTSAYIQAKIPVAWLAILTADMKAEMIKTSKGHVVRKFSPRPFHKWVHAYYFKNLWFIDPDSGDLWVGELSAHLIEVPSSHWYGEGGEELSAGGYSRRSKRWRDLHLNGPIRIDDVDLSTPMRHKAWSGGGMSLPAGLFLKLAEPE
jgi:competence protein CoiA